MIWIIDARSTHLFVFFEGAEWAQGRQARVDGGAEEQAGAQKERALQQGEVTSQRVFGGP